MLVTGNIEKMQTQWAQEVLYWLPLDEERILMNEYVGETISLTFENQINCIVCGRITTKSFAQGFCFPCFAKSPENAECIIRPELCKGHLGEGRDREWELLNHVKPHFVYLAASSDIKVGVTRDTQIPTRWIDQGADAAVRFALTPNRYLAGAIEVALKQHLTDKTDWRKMLRGEKTNKNLIEIKHALRPFLAPEFADFFYEDNMVTLINYPIIRLPEKVNSVGFDKSPQISGVLNGIKGQYLIFDNDTVINMRAHGGYRITLEA
ncbi:MAG: DUF2797 domain-containing protein [Bacteroidetes bacterium]|nr:DUF2797 domain-containing protein [Bacteroidota bacterium]